MILLIDNYDSFTWNLVQALASLGAEVCVQRNDALDVSALLALGASAVVLSPGPGRPEAAGVCPELLRRLPDSMPLLGVCLGHQALVQQYGGRIEVDPVPVHGKATLVHHDGGALYRDLPDPFAAGRYHSLHTRREGLPRELELAAWTSEGLVMGVRHRELPRHGVQFHPESILTPEGIRLLAAFLALSGDAHEARSAGHQAQ
ncbi:MAG TPA: aminodeoxychorismate/anthranilate synthase component II [Planctomycetota bacterium]|nr:aminodeoxychorismate/anthranilate synthase component II [Planctomycetota bacterium]